MGNDPPFFRAGPFFWMDIVYPFRPSKNKSVPFFPHKVTASSLNPPFNLSASPRQSGAAVLPLFHFVSYQGLSTYVLLFSAALHFISGGRQNMGNGPHFPHIIPFHFG
jgi:hypothetical protein